MLQAQRSHARVVNPPACNLTSSEKRAQRGPMLGRF
jgi:hypothetical protein